MSDVRSLTRKQIIDKLDDYQVVWLTLWAEARGEPFEGILAVACVIRNRTKRRKQSYREVCLARKQFSCWIPAGGTKNYHMLMDAAEALVHDGAGPTTLVAGECKTIASHIMVDRFRDRSHGADHYYSPLAMRPKGAVPSWANGVEPACTIGRHVFFNLEGKR